ncbi:DUF3375 domain-containing protein [Lapillicoccus sp.]|uniref:DUF3375 domain-containing protein n=1 Tax=Lapillicoccus sp. TaxID=1909287 RepID=UPI0027C53E29|nr:DUF3375 domain-containing protein [Actinomycetota bacterium]
MLTFDELTALRDRHASWRLLRATNAPLVISFLSRVFVEENVRLITQAELVSRLDDELHALRTSLGEDAFPKSAAAYIADWASNDAGWLRLYYTQASDEPHVDATPALEKAAAWLESLRERSFVGTESRLNTVVDLLRQIVQGADADPDRRLGQLRAERARLDQLIARAEDGQIDVLDPTAQRDRYQQFSATARDLLSDFREVEVKFRALDREMRETIAGWSGAKGELLDHVLGDRNAISDSDQGRSFHAFYDFLLSADRQDELADLLDAVHRLNSIEADPRVRRIDHDWLSAADRTQATVRLLSDQLRRFLDDTAWLENQRVMDLLRSIEAASIAMRDKRVPLDMDLDAIRPEVSLPFERPLYALPAPSEIDSSIGDSDESVETGALFGQDHIDHQRIVAHIKAALAHRSQIPLSELLASQPLDHGLAELVAYLGVSEEGVDLVFDDAARARVAWRDDQGAGREADAPTVIYVRHEPAQSTT